ncbi:hypothetical protein Tco_1345172 [Tanacetum coccineum]
MVMMVGRLMAVVERWWCSVGCGMAGWCGAVRNCGAVEWCKPLVGDDGDVLCRRRSGLRMCGCDSCGGCTVTVAAVVVKEWYGGGMVVRRDGEDVLWNVVEVAERQRRPRRKIFFGGRKNQEHRKSL